MGRGRAKAKQVKVARRLKYDTSGTDLDRLREELGTSQPAAPDDHDSSGEDDANADLTERYSDYAEDEGRGG